MTWMSGSAASASKLPYAFGTPSASALRRAEASLLAAIATTSTNPRRRTASMWCAPTKPGPIRPMPMRVMRSLPPPLARCSGERLLHIVETLRDLFDRRARPAIFVLDVRADRPAFLFQQLQDFADRGVPFAPACVVPLILLTILQVQIGDVRMVLADVRDGVEVAGGEMADIEVHLEVLRHLHGGGEAV